MGSFISSLKYKLKGVNNKQIRPNSYAKIIQKVIRNIPESSATLIIVSKEAKGWVKSDTWKSCASGHLCTFLQVFGC